MTSVPQLADDQAGVPRSLEWLEQHAVIWNRDTGILPSIIIGVYRRASTLGQIAGYRQSVMIDDMTDVVLRKGPAYGVIVFDEGHRSGTSLSGRTVAMSMIDFLTRGLIQGIAAPDVKRLCRDEWVGGGREMARALRKHRGILILDRGDELNLRRRLQRKAFMHELKLASDEIDEIKYTMYSGIVARARLTAEGKVEPMFRGPAPYGYRHVDCRDEHGELVRSRGAVRRTLEKHPAHAAGMALMMRLFDSEPTLNTVARKLNLAGVGADIHRGETSEGWTGQRLRGLLKNPVFHGVWRAVRERKSDVWDDFDEADIQTPVPQLAYWSETQAQQWLERFVQPIQRRQRVHQRPFISTLRCDSCRGPMTSGGYHGYRCRTANPVRQGLPSPTCAKPQTIAHTSVAAVLRGLFIENIGHIARVVAAEHEQQKLAASQQGDPLVAQLTTLDEQEDSLLSLVQGDRAMSDKLRQRYDWIQAERARIKDKQARRQVIVRLTDEQVATFSILTEQPGDLYDDLGENQQGELWRQLGRHVTVHHDGGRGKTARYTGAILGESLSENSIWIVTGYLTQAS